MHFRFTRHLESEAEAARRQGGARGTRPPPATAGTARSMAGLKGVDASTALLKTRAGVGAGGAQVDEACGGGDGDGGGGGDGLDRAAPRSTEWRRGAPLFMALALLSAGSRWGAPTLRVKQILFLTFCPPGGLGLMDGPPFPRTCDFTACFSSKDIPQLTPIPLSCSAPCRWVAAVAAALKLHDPVPASLGQPGRRGLEGVADENLVSIGFGLLGGLQEEAASQLEAAATLGETEAAESVPEGWSVGGVSVVWAWSGAPSDETAFIAAIAHLGAAHPGGAAQAEPSTQLKPDLKGTDFIV